MYNEVYIIAVYSIPIYIGVYIHVYITIHINDALYMSDTKTADTYIYTIYGV